MIEAALNGGPASLSGGSRAPGGAPGRGLGFPSARCPGHAGARTRLRLPARARWRAGTGGHRRAALPRRGGRAAGRVPRGGRVLRAVRVPHHRAAAGRARAHRADRAGRVLGAARPPAAAGAAHRARRDRRRRAVLAGRHGGRAAARGRARGAVLRRELADDLPGQRLLHPDRRPVAAAAHLVPGHRGAVLLALAADRAGPAGARRAVGTPGGVRDRGDRRARLRRGRRPAVPARRRQPGLLRHRHPGAGAADRLRPGDPPAGPRPLAAGRRGGSRHGGYRLVLDARHGYQRVALPGRPGRRGAGGGRGAGPRRGQPARPDGLGPGAPTPGVAGPHLLRRLPVALAAVPVPDRRADPAVGGGLARAALRAHRRRRHRLVRPRRAADPARALGAAGAAVRAGRGDRARHGDGRGARRRGHAARTGVGGGRRAGGGRAGAAGGGRGARDEGHAGPAATDATPGPPARRGAPGHLLRRLGVLDAGHLPAAAPRDDRDGTGGAGLRHRGAPGHPHHRYPAHQLRLLPDVAVILLDRWELMDRKLDGAYHHVGEPAFDAYLTGQLDQAVSTASARGARVVLLTAPYTHRSERPDGGLYPEDEPARVDAWNALLRAEAAKHADNVTVLDLAKVVCPNGAFTWTINGMRVRSDGLHFTPAAVQRLIAPWLLPQLARLARE